MNGTTWLDCNGTLVSAQQRADGSWRAVRVGENGEMIDGRPEEQALIDKTYGPQAKPAKDELGPRGMLMDDTRERR